VISITFLEAAYLSIPSIPNITLSGSPENHFFPFWLDKSSFLSSNNPHRLLELKIEKRGKRKGSVGD
jgi:hypothetical protein